MFNSFVWAIFQGYKEAKDSNVDRKFKDLNRTWDCWIGEATTSLLEVSDLNRLLGEAKNKDHYNEILDHLYRHDATRVDPYKEIENKIIDRMWD
jgi:hypothetical protein